MALAVALTAAVTVAGCSVRSDGPGRSIDPSRIPDAQPKALPKSESGNPDSYVVAGERYEVRDSAEGYVAEGRASWYGSKFHGQRTSSGERYDMYAMTAAHRTLPLPTFVRVTHLENGKSGVVKVNDRGPFHQNRLIDLSYAAALRLGIAESGTARVRIRALTTPGEPVPLPSADAGDGASAGAGADTPSSQSAASAQAGSFLQIGAFTHFTHAQRMRARARGADIAGVEVVRGRTDDGDKIYRVRIGPFDDAGERAGVRRKLERADIGPIDVVAGGDR